MKKTLPIYYAINLCLTCHGKKHLASSDFFLQIEDITLTQLRIQLNTSYGRKGEETVTEAWDYLQTIVSRGNNYNNIMSHLMRLWYFSTP